MSDQQAIGILTAGGDCPGLNAVIRGAVVQAVSLGYKVIGFRRGFQGLLPTGQYTQLDIDDVEGLHLAGGTILNTSHENPLKATNGIEGITATFKKHNIRGLIVVGGLTTLGYAKALCEEFDFTIIGVPKTINNDVSGTDYCFGFYTAVTNATETIDRLITVARSHERVMVVELKCGSSGILAYYAGLASAANMILVPECAFTMDDVKRMVIKRRDEGYASSLIVVAENAWPSDLTRSEKPKRDRTERETSLVAEALARHITAETKIEAEAIVLDTLLRSGSPAGFDRVLGTRFGALAANLCHDEKFGRMVAVKGNMIEDIPFDEAIKPRVLDKTLADQTKIFCG
jgi:6-phosphofructokinase 1